MFKYIILLLIFICSVFGEVYSPLSSEPAVITYTPFEIHPTPSKFGIEALNFVKFPESAFSEYPNDKFSGFFIHSDGFKTVFSYNFWRREDRISAENINLCVILSNSSSAHCFKNCVEGTGLNKGKYTCDWYKLNFSYSFSCSHIHGSNYKVNYSSDIPICSECKKGDKLNDEGMCYTDCSDGKLKVGFTDGTCLDASDCDKIDGDKTAKIQCFMDKWCNYNGGTYSGSSVITNAEGKNYSSCNNGEFPVSIPDSAFTEKPKPEEPDPNIPSGGGEDNPDKPNDSNPTNPDKPNDNNPTNPDKPNDNNPTNPDVFDPVYRGEVTDTKIDPNTSFDSDNGFSSSYNNATGGIIGNGSFNSDVFAGVFSNGSGEIAFTGGMQDLIDKIDEQGENSKLGFDKFIDGLDKIVDDFGKAISGAFNSISSPTSSLSRVSVSSCPKELNFSGITAEIDICKAVSPASGIVYLISFITFLGLACFFIFKILALIIISI
ncbi:putative membrane protein [Campylobacter iguaniorum]|uniref:hypothetical protein n=1 Tax=Campylobacter iguaniorum TaxID=1244531 RepID=UPI0007C8D48F|nr:hypothetical protein [Campylobacter iguaniorum]ANE35836.1 putative membrane protein [Campylobacter iguaniorum]